MGSSSPGVVASPKRAGRELDLEVSRGDDTGEDRRQTGVEVLFKRFDAALTKAGFLRWRGQIIDATNVATPKQRNSEAEKKDIKEGRIPEDWTRKPAKLRQKDRDARWTVKYSKAKPSQDGAKRVDLAIPAFGYKNDNGSNAPTI